MKVEKDVAVILLAGGTGSRMKSDIPKQFLQLKNKPIVLHSFELFVCLQEAVEIVVICSPEYRHLFHIKDENITLTFAMPGERRQDSVYNGLQAITSNSQYVCVHDSARPCVTLPMIQRVIAAAHQHGAATAAMPIKFTVKEADQDLFVTQTPDRSRIWEIQTPQVIRKDWLKDGFAYALKNNLTVTDDVSLVELLKKPVKLVEGCYSNLKITTQEDLRLSESLIRC